MAFSYSVDESDGVVRMSFVGEIDMSVSDRVAEIVREALTAYEPRQIEIDLSELDFCDSSGITALFAARTAAAEAGCDFAATRPHGMVKRVMEITGVLDALTGAVGPDPAGR